MGDRSFLFRIGEVVMSKREARRLNAEIQHLLEKAGTDESVTAVRKNPQRLQELRDLFGPGSLRRTKKKLQRTGDKGQVRPQVAAH